MQFNFVPTLNGRVASIHDLDGLFRLIQKIKDVLQLVPEVHPLGLFLKITSLGQSPSPQDEALVMAVPL